MALLKDKTSEEGKPEEPKEATPKEDQAKEAEADAQLPFHKHPRWQEVLRERNEAREQVVAANAQVEQLQDAATRMGNIETYAQENDLNAEEFDAGLKIMALMKSDPQAAYDALKPYMEGLEQATGLALPEDLQAAVDDGDVSLEFAQREAKRRAGDNQTLARATSQVDRTEATAFEAAKSSLVSWMQSWERADRQSAEKFRPLFHPRFTQVLGEWRNSTGRQNPSPDEVVKMADQVKGELDARSEGT